MIIAGKMLPWSVAAASSGLNSNSPPTGHPLAMLTETYIEALLLDEDLADQVGKAWDNAEITEVAACIAWLYIADLVSRRNHQRASLPSQINALR